MKQTHDKLRKVKDFNVGDAVGVIIPNVYVTSAAKIVPAIVIDKQLKEDENLYKLAYRTYVIDANYYAHELIALVGDVHYMNMGLSVKTILDYVSDIQKHINDKEAMSLPLRSIYEMYLLEISDDYNRMPISLTQNENDTNKDAQEEETETEMSIDNETDVNTEEKNKVVKNCCVCDMQIQSDAHVSICGKCKRPMHKKEVCKYGTVQYVDEVDHELRYCSISCYQQPKCYEVCIVGENVKKNQYLMQYNTGEIITKSKRIVDKLAQYYKMVCVWREAHPEPKQSVYESDDDEVMIISATNNEETCCVCNRILSLQNWHKCYGCKRRMHGKIICEKSELIYQDDDKLFCSEKCKLIN
jgi:hypothetical protein